MKIFITGSSGYIGQEVVKRLSGKHEIVEYDVINGQDILDYENLKKKMCGCDVVVHLAAIRGPDEAKIFADYFDINCRGTFNVAEAAIENGVKRLIYSSSTGYYGLERGVPYVKPIKEQNPVITQYVKADWLDCRDCDIAYSTSKVIAEQILANYGLRKKLEVMILRLGPIGSKRKVSWGVDGITLNIDAAIQSLEKAVNVDEIIWYEAFTITDKSDKVKLTKAEKLLGYEPFKP